MGLKKETIIISLGGSLVVPSKIDLAFLKKFKNLLKKQFKTKNFLILVGGGKPAREYQAALKEFGANDIEKDWVGIDVSRLNAKVVKNLFSKDAYSKIITNPTKKIYTLKKVIVGGGYKPGWSTDYVSVLVAKTYNIKTIINLTNIDYVYDKDPKKFKTAKPQKEIDWKSFQKIVGTKWTPGLSVPFDPRASLLASKLKMKVVIINGKKLKSLENFLNGKKFVGTTIQ